MATLYPYPVTALAVNDSVGTGGNNTIASVTIAVYDLSDNVVTLYDDENSLNPEATKTTGADGKVIIWLEAGRYRVTFDGGSDSWFDVGARQPYDSVSDMAADSSILVGEQVETVAYYGGWAAESTPPVGGNKYIKVAGQTPAEDGGSIIYTADGNHLRGLFPQGYVTPDMFGAKSTPADFTVGYLSECQACLDYANTNRVTVKGDGVYVVEGQLNIGSANVDMQEGEFVLANGFPVVADAAILAGKNKETPSSKTPRTLNFTVNGNRDNQTNGTVAVQIKDLVAPLGKGHIKVKYVYTGVKVYGNTEKLNLTIGGFIGDILLHETWDGADSADENYYILQGSQFGVWYKQEGKLSSYVHFQCENANDTGENCVQVLGGKMCTLAGEIRGLFGGGIFVNDETLNLDLGINNLQIISTASSSPIALDIKNCRTVMGKLNVRDVNGDAVARIGKVPAGTDLTVIATDVILNDANNYAFQLGDFAESLQLSRSTLKLALYSANCKAVNHDYTDNVEVDLIGFIASGGAAATAGAYDFTANSLDDVVSLPQSYILDDISVSSASPDRGAPSIKFRGNLSTVDLDAYSTPFEGMYVENCRTFKNMAGYYLINGWGAPAGIESPVDEADFSDLTSRVNTLCKYEGRQQFVKETNKTVFSTGSAASNLWVYSDGTTAYTPT